MSTNGTAPRTDWRSDHPVMRAEPEADQLLTAKQLSERWMVPKAHVYRLARDGRLPKGTFINLGRYRRFSLAGIREFEQNGGTDE